MLLFIIREKSVYGNYRRSDAGTKPCGSGEAGHVTFVALVFPWAFVDNKEVERGLTAPPPIYTRDKGIRDTKSGIRVAGTPSLRRGVPYDLYLVERLLLANRGGWPQ